MPNEALRFQLSKMRSHLRGDQVYGDVLFGEVPEVLFAIATEGEGGDVVQLGVSRSQILRLANICDMSRPSGPRRRRVYGIRPPSKPMSAALVRLSASVIPSGTLPE